MSEAAVAAGAPDPRGARRRRLLLALRIAVAGVLVALILQWIDLAVVGETLARVDLRLFAAVVAIALIDRYLMAYKWALLARTRGVAIASGEAFRIYLASGFVGAFLPTGVGADVFRVLRTSTEGRGIDRVSASVLLERVIGMLATTVLSLIGLGILAHGDPETFFRLYLGVWVFLGVLVLAVLVSIQDRAYRVVKRLLGPFEKYRPVRMYLSLHRAYTEDLDRHWEILLLFFALSFVEQFLLALLNYLGALALGLVLPFVVFVGLIPLSGFVTLLPISIGSIGVADGAYIVLFGLVGWTASQALALSIFIHVLTWFMLIPGGLVLAWETFRFRRLQNSASQ